MIQKVFNRTDIQTIEKLAFKIWNSHYVPIIGKNQVDYMLEKFQNFNAISLQIQNGYEYFLISTNNKAIGYLCLLLNSATQKIMISKIYIDQSERNSGFGKQLIDFTIDRAKEKKIKTIWLTVNKNNSNTIKWYEKLNFKITKETVIDIGNDYIMDDYVLELCLD